MFIIRAVSSTTVQPRGGTLSDVAALPIEAWERQMPKGYFFAEIEITDPADYDTYRSQTMATLQKYGGAEMV